jgi:hypothetical protein
VARTARLTIRLEPDEKELIQEMARRSLRKDSDWARIILLNACMPEQTDSEETEESDTERIGGLAARDLDLPCTCGHAEGVHDGPDKAEKPQCQLCPKGVGRYHVYIADTEKRRAV